MSFVAQVPHNDLASYFVRVEFNDVSTLEPLLVIPVSTAEHML